MPQLLDLVSRYPNDTMLIELAHLHLDEQSAIGSGGEGAIYEIDAQSVHSAGWQGPAVAKLYKHSLPEPALRDLLDRVRWADSLSAGVRAELYRAAAWPLMVIGDQGALAGIVMPDERERYEAQIHLPSGASQFVLMSLEHVLQEDGYLETRFKIPCDTRVRAALGERLAAALAVLHRHGIVASDISHRNVLVSLAEPYSVTLIDCDSMTFQGNSPLRVVETPDWEIPPQWGEYPTTRGADAYKLGLAVLRLFARSQSERLPGPVEPYVPTALRDLLRDALGSKPGLRPSAGRWQGALRDVLGTPLVEDFPGPPSRRSTQAGTPGRGGHLGAGPPRRGGNAGAPAAWPPATTTMFQAPPLVGAVAGVGTATPIAAPGAPAAHTGALGPTPPIPPPPLAPGSLPRTGWPGRGARIMLVLIVIAAAIIADALLNFLQFHPPVHLEHDRSPHRPGVSASLRASTDRLRRSAVSPQSPALPPPRDWGRRRKGECPILGRILHQLGVLRGRPELGCAHRPGLGCAHAPIVAAPQPGRRGPSWKAAPNSLARPLVAAAVACRAPPRANRAPAAGVAAACRAPPRANRSSAAQVPRGFCSRDQSPCGADARRAVPRVDRTRSVLSRSAGCPQRPARPRTPGWR